MPRRNRRKPADEPAEGKPRNYRTPRDWPASQDIYGWPADARDVRVTARDAQTDVSRSYGPRRVTVRRIGESGEKPLWLNRF